MIETLDEVNLSDFSPAFRVKESEGMGGILVFFLYLNNYVL